MSKKATTGTKAETTNPDFIFGKNNYRLLLIGIGVLALGFILMMGSTDILDFRKITLAPLTILAGFATVGVAILVKPKDA